MGNRQSTGGMADPPGASSDTSMDGDYPSAAADGFHLPSATSGAPGGPSGTGARGGGDPPPPRPPTLAALRLTTRRLRSPVAADARAAADAVSAYCKATLAAPPPAASAAADPVSGVGGGPRSSGHLRSSTGLSGRRSRLRSGAGRAAAEAASAAALRKAGADDWRSPVGGVATASVLEAELPALVRLLANVVELDDAAAGADGVEAVLSGMDALAGVANLATAWAAADAEAASAPAGGGAQAKAPSSGRSGRRLGVPLCRRAVPALLRRLFDADLRIATVAASALEVTVRVPSVAGSTGWPAVADAALDYRHEQSPTALRQMLSRLAAAHRAATAAAAAVVGARRVALAASLPADVSSGAGGSGGGGGGGGGGAAQTATSSVSAAGTTAVVPSRMSLTSRLSTTLSAVGAAGNPATAAASTALRERRMLACSRALVTTYTVYLAMLGSATTREPAHRRAVLHAVLRVLLSARPPPAPDARRRRSGRTSGSPLSDTPLHDSPSDGGPASPSPSSSWASSPEEGEMRARRGRRRPRADEEDQAGDAGDGGGARRRLNVDSDTGSASARAHSDADGAVGDTSAPVDVDAAGATETVDPDSDGVGEPDVWPRPSAADYAAVAAAGVTVHARALHSALFDVLFYRTSPGGGTVDGAKVAAVPAYRSAVGAAVASDTILPAARCAPRAFLAATAAFFLLLQLAPWTMDRLELTAAFTHAARARFGPRRPDGGFEDHPSPPMLLAAASATQFVVALGILTPAGGVDALLSSQAEAATAVRAARRLLSMPPLTDDVVGSGGFGGPSGGSGLGGGRRGGRAGLAVGASASAGLAAGLAAMTAADARRNRSLRIRRTLGSASPDWASAVVGSGREGRPRRHLRVVGSGSGRIGESRSALLDDDGTADDDAASGVAATEGGASSSVWSLSSRRFRSRRSLLFGPARSSMVHGGSGGGGDVSWLGGSSRAGSRVSRDGPSPSDVTSLTSEATGDLAALRRRYASLVASREHADAEAALVWSRVAAMAVENAEDFTRVAATAATVAGNTRMGTPDASIAAACRTAARRGMVASLHSVASALAAAPPGMFPYRSPLYCRLVLMLSDAAKVGVTPIDASWCSSDRARAVGLQDDGTYIVENAEVRTHASSVRPTDPMGEWIAARHRSSSSVVSELSGDDGSDHSSYPDSPFDNDRCSDAACQCNSLAGGDMVTTTGGTPPSGGSGHPHVRLAADSPLPEYGDADDDSFVDDEGDLTDRTRGIRRRPAWQGGRALDERGGATTQQVLRELAELVLVRGVPGVSTRPPGMPYGGNDAVDYAPHGQHHEFDRFYDHDAPAGEDNDELAEADAADRRRRPDVTDEQRREERDRLFSRLWRRRWHQRGGRRPDASHVGDEFVGALAAVTAVLTAAVGTRRAGRDIARSALAAIACDTRVREHVYHTRAHVGAALELGHERHRAAMTAALEAERLRTDAANANVHVRDLCEGVAFHVKRLIAAATARRGLQHPPASLSQADERQLVCEARRYLQTRRGLPVDEASGELHDDWEAWVHAYMSAPDGGADWEAINYSAAVEAAAAVGHIPPRDYPFYYEDGGGPMLSPEVLWPTHFSGTGAEAANPEAVQADPSSGDVAAMYAAAEGTAYPNGSGEQGVPRLSRTTDFGSTLPYSSPVDARIDEQEAAVVAVPASCASAVAAADGGAVANGWDAKAAAAAQAAASTIGDDDAGGDAQDAVAVAKALAAAYAASTANGGTGEVPLAVPFAVLIQRESRMGAAFGAAIAHDYRVARSAGVADLEAYVNDPANWSGFRRYATAAYIKVAGVRSTTQAAVSARQGGKPVSPWTLVTPPPPLPPAYVEGAERQSWVVEVLEEQRHRDEAAEADDTSSVGMVITPARPGAAGLPAPGAVVATGEVDELTAAVHAGASGGGPGAPPPATATVGADAATAAAAASAAANVASIDRVRSLVLERARAAMEAHRRFQASDLANADGAPADASTPSTSPARTGVSGSGSGSGSGGRDGVAATAPVTGLSPSPDVEDLPPSPARSADRNVADRSADRGIDRPRSGGHWSSVTPSPTTAARTASGGRGGAETGAAGAPGAAAAAANGGDTGRAASGARRPPTTTSDVDDAAVETVLAAVTATPATIRRWFEGVSLEEEDVAAASLSGAGTPAAASPRTVALSAAAVQAPPMDYRAIKELGRCLALLLTAIAASATRGGSAAAVVARLARDVEAVASPALRSLHAAALSHAAATTSHAALVRAGAGAAAAAAAGTGTGGVRDAGATGGVAVAARPVSPSPSVVAAGASADGIPWATPAAPDGSAIGAGSTAEDPFLAAQLVVARRATETATARATALEAQVAGLRTALSQATLERSSTGSSTVGEVGGPPPLLARGLAGAPTAAGPTTNRRSTAPARSVGAASAAAATAAAAAAVAGATAPAAAATAPGRSSRGATVAAAAPNRKSPLSTVPSAQAGRGPAGSSRGLGGGLGRRLRQLRAAKDARRGERSDASEALRPSRV